MKVEWINVLELFIAGVLLSIFWAFLKGPCHRMAYRLHGIHPHGGRYAADEEPGRDEE